MVSDPIRTWLDAAGATGVGEQALRMWTDHMQDVFWVLDLASRRLTYVSLSVTALRGMTPEEVLAEPLAEGFAPESYQRFLHTLDVADSPDTRRADTGTALYDQPCRDGAIKHVEITTRWVRDADGQATALLGVSRDVTRRVDTEVGRNRLAADLRQALAEVKRLESLIPVCSYCHKVRDDQAFWSAVESFISERPDTKSSHAICPACASSHFPERGGETHLAIRRDVYDGYMASLCSGNRTACQSTVLALLSEGVPVRTLYRSLFKQSLYDIGRRWEMGTVTVATEHLATSITEDLLTLAHRHARRLAGNGLRAIVCCVSDDFHQLGARIVADVLELRGWAVSYVGVGTPSEVSVARTRDAAPHLVCLSVTLMAYVDNAIQLVEQLRAAGITQPVVIGGQAAPGIPRAWRADQAHVRVLATLEEFEYALPEWEGASIGSTGP